MTRRSLRRRTSPWVEVGFLSLLLFAVVWLGQSLQDTPGVIALGSADSELGELTDSQKEALKIVGEMEKLLLSLAGLLIGGVVAVVAKDGQVRPPPPRPARLLLIATFAAASSSMYFGFFTYVRLLELLEENHFSAHAQQIWAPLSWQYRLFLSAVLGLATFVCLSWFSNGSDSAKKEKGP